MNRRKSAAEHRLIGTSRADRVPRPPTGTGVGKPPADLAAELHPVWAELTAAVPAGVGSRHDHGAFELMCRLTLKMRSPGGVNAAEVSHLKSLYETFAMTPMGRHKLGLSIAEPPKPAAGKPSAEFDF